MNQKKPYLLFIFFFFYASSFIYSQEYKLRVSSKKEKENLFLSNIYFKKNHIDTISIYNELYIISNYLKTQGYFLNTIDKIIKDEKNYHGIFSLNEKIEYIYLNTQTLSKDLKKKLKIKNKEIKIPLNELKLEIRKINKILNDSGKVFSKITLKNFNLKKEILYADLIIKKTEQRFINKVIFKDYEDFPKSFKKNYFNIKEKTIFNQKKLKEISSLTKALDFTDEIKPPETLFTKDSTYIYMYLKKKQNSSFDGLVNFSSKENDGVLFNGHLDLNLNNILNTGEKLNLFWNSINNESQEFKITIKTPFIFNSKITPEISFKIYKQDSTFINTKFDIKLFYNISSKSNLSLTYNSENSENLTNKIDNNVESYNNYFLGIGYQYKIIKNDFLNSHKFFFDINPSFGNRKNKGISSSQFKIESNISYIIDVNKRNSIFLKNSFGFLDSQNILTNELFRIGGPNSIRGFNEQSIFVKNYTIQNFEYRYLTSNTSYIYSVTDFGFINTLIKREKLLGIGLGYLFKTKNSQINLSVVTGSNLNDKINLKNTQFLVNWINFF